MNFVLILLLVPLSSLANTDYYQLLGLQRGADLDTVKKQFRKLSLQYHPDKNPSPKALELYKKITHAYQSIVNEINGKGNKDYFRSGKKNDQTDFEEEFYRWYQEEERRRYDDEFRRKSGRNSDYEKNRYQREREWQYEQERRRQEQQRNEEEYFRRKNNEKTNNFGNNDNDQGNQEQKEQNQSYSKTVLTIIFAVIFALGSQWWRICIRKPSKSAQKQPSYLESPQWQQIYQNYE